MVVFGLFVRQELVDEWTDDVYIVNDKNAIELNSNMTVRHRVGLQKLLLVFLSCKYLFLFKGREFMYFLKMAYVPLQVPSRKFHAQ